eukprot:9666614-Lingulodinium_polyedra.AAC.1
MELPLNFFEHAIRYQCRTLPRQGNMQGMAESDSRVPGCLDQGRHCGESQADATQRGPVTTMAAMARR